MVNLDNTDKRIIKLLKSNSRMSYKAMGDSLKIPATTLKDRVNRLMNQSIIDCFTIKIDHRALGLRSYLLHIRCDPKNTARITKKILGESTSIYSTKTGHIFSVEQLQDYDDVQKYVEGRSSMEGVREIDIYLVSEDV